MSDVAARTMVIERVIKAPVGVVWAFVWHLADGCAGKECSA
jgi:uncharacterized protein YndB with AHSA1/START domain